MKGIVAQIEGRIPVALDTVFDVFAPVDLTTIMRGHGPLPAVIAVEDQSGAWNEIGESRIVRLSDGGALLETLTAFDRPRHIAYTINELTNALRFLVSEFHGAWFFEEGQMLLEDAVGSGGAPVVIARWRYEFVSRSFLAWPLVWLVVTCFWKPYMVKALDLAARQAIDAAGPVGSNRDRGDHDGGSLASL